MQFRLSGARKAQAVVNVACSNQFSELPLDSGVADVAQVSADVAPESPTRFVLTDTVGDRVNVHVSAKTRPAK